MVNNTERLSRLLHDAIVEAEGVRTHNEVLWHLRHARISLGELSSPSGIRIDVLSGQVFSGGVRVALSPSEAALVIALAVRHGSVHRDILAETLYGDSDPRNAANALKVVVHRVRRRLASRDIIHHEHGLYSLAAAVDINFPRTLPRPSEGALDADERERFETLRHRIIAGRPGFMLEWSWFDAVERSLVDFARDIGLLLARDALCAGRFERAVDIGTELQRDDPLDEAAAEIIVQGLLRIGDRHGADTFYRRYADNVRRECNALPSSQITRLFTTAAVASGER
jgi:SARP family transcriptional regulator, regulator of embCAB operon